MTVLPDTSIWVSYLREGSRGVGASLDQLLAGGEVVVCGPIAAEILAGTAAAKRAELWALLAALDWEELRREHWRRVGEVSARLRKRGQTVPLTDIVIAVAAVAAGAQLWSTDADFDRVAHELPDLLRYSDQ